MSSSSGGRRSGGGGRRRGSEPYVPPPLRAQEIEEEEMAMSSSSAGRGGGGSRRGSEPYVPPPLRAQEIEEDEMAMSSSSAGRGGGARRRGSEPLRAQEIEEEEMAMSSSSAGRGGGRGGGGRRRGKDIEEEEMVVATTVTTATMGPLKPRPMDRPGVGTTGNRCMVRANHFLIDLTQSDVAITVEDLNIVLKKIPSEDYVTVNRSFFSRAFGNTTDIGLGLECWRGYYQSVRPTQMGLSLNIDISATSFYKPISVLEFAAEYLNIHDTSISLTMEQNIALGKALSGITVEVTHRNDMRRRYKIIRLTTDSLRQITFLDSRMGKQRLVKDYFKDKYLYPLEHVDWPCLQVGSADRPTYLPMEVCKIVKGQRFSKILNVKQVKKILKLKCERPEQREKSISKMVAHNKYKKDRYAQRFGIKVMDQLTSVEARILPPPTLKYHNSGEEKICIPKMGAWNMNNKKLVNGGKIKMWKCFSFSQSLYSWQLHQFCNSLFHVCNDIGMDILEVNNVLRFSAVKVNKVEEVLRDKQYNLDTLQLLLVVLPDDLPNDWFYDVIKRVCETELGIVSQCCQPINVKACSLTYMENVALKINVKVGGRNTVIDDALDRGIRLVTDKPTIIFGADVTHAHSSKDSSFSIAAVVASMDWPELSNYRGVVRAQKRGQELIEDLYIETHNPHKPDDGMIGELLLAFYKANNHEKPHRIIFYRDGVSEGEFSQVLLHEMDAIRNACKSLQDGYAPPVTFVVVQKRHNTRLFPECGSNQVDQTGNILPGTVVDTIICHPTEYDFYLCSHAGIQGTSRPTHYHVLLDENEFSADQLQALTNNLCYTYVRCTRSVSVVPPVYYAHLAASRARCYVKKESGEGSVGGTHVQNADVKPLYLPDIHNNLKDVMFYC